MSSPQKNIIRSWQTQQCQGPHVNNNQNSRACPAAWSPGFGLLDHKALLKAPAAPAGTRPAAAARRLVLTSSKQSPSKAGQGPQLLQPPSAPKVTKAFLRQRFQASQNALLQTCSQQAAPPAVLLADKAVIEATMAVPHLNAAAAAAGSSFPDMLEPDASTASCKRTCLPAAFSKLKITVPNPAAAAATSSADAPIKVDCPSSNPFAPCSAAAASPASNFTTSTKTCSIRGGQAYPPDVAAPAQLGWGEITPAYRPDPQFCNDSSLEAAAVLARKPLPACSPDPLSCKSSSLEAAAVLAGKPLPACSPDPQSCKDSSFEAAAVFAGKPLSAPDHVTVTILDSHASHTASAAAQQQQEQEQEALVRLTLLLDGDRVHAVISTIEPLNPASNIANWLSSSSWLAAGAEAGVFGCPTTAATAMFGALLDSFWECHPECPCPAKCTARKRWQAAGAAIMFRRLFCKLPWLQDPTAMQAELLAAAVLGPSRMMQLWQESAPYTAAQLAEEVWDVRLVEGLHRTGVENTGIFGAAATVEMAGSVAPVHLELPPSLYYMLPNKSLPWAANSSCSECGEHSVTYASDLGPIAGRGHSRTSVQSPIPTGPANSIASSGLAGATAADRLAAHSSTNRPHKQATGKSSTRLRGFFDALFRRKAKTQSLARPLQPSQGASPTQHATASNTITAAAAIAPKLTCRSSNSSSSIVEDTSTAHFAAAAHAADSPAIDHTPSSSSSSTAAGSIPAGPMAAATVKVAGNTAHVHLELHSGMFDQLQAVIIGDQQGSYTTCADGHQAEPSTAADDEAYPSNDVLQRIIEAFNSGQSLCAQLGQPITFEDDGMAEFEAAMQLPMAVNEWQALFEQRPGQGLQVHTSSRRRRCCRGGPPTGDDSDSDDEEMAGFTAHAVPEPASDDAVPLPAPGTATFKSGLRMLADNSNDSMVLTARVQAFGNLEKFNSSGCSSGSIVDASRDGSFAVPDPEEEEEAGMGLADKQQQQQNRTADRRGSGSWWGGKMSSSFRKAAVGVFGLTGSSSSSKKLQGVDRTDAAARPSADTVTTEEEEEHEIEVAHAAGGSPGVAGGNESGAGRVGYLAKLFSIRSRRDVLLAAGDQ